VEMRESQAILSLLALVPVSRLAAAALAELLSRRRGLARPVRYLSPAREGRRTSPSQQQRSERMESWRHMELCIDSRVERASSTKDR
jgi:hypothetical protein